MVLQTLSYNLYMKTSISIVILLIAALRTAYGNADFFPALTLGIAIVMVAGGAFVIVSIEAIALKFGFALSSWKALFVSFCANLTTAFLGILTPWERHLWLSDITGIGTTPHFIWWLSSSTLVNTAVELLVIRWAFKIVLSGRRVLIFFIANLITVGLLISLMWESEIENVVEMTPPSQSVAEREDQPGQKEYHTAQEYQKQGDMKNAIELYRRAADKGERYAASALGDIYRQGQGVPKDFDAAKKWYRLAAERGDLYARSRLKVLRLERND